MIPSEQIPSVILPLIIPEGIYLIPENELSTINNNTNTSTLVPGEAALHEPSGSDKNHAEVHTTQKSSFESPRIIGETFENGLYKLVILVGYKGDIPANIQEALQKLCAALGLKSNEYTIINALDPKSTPVDTLTFEALLLLGGTGKNIQKLKNYSGKRTFYEAGTVDNFRVLFAEAMEVYIANNTLKKKFWQFLKNEIG